MYKILVSCCPLDLHVMRVSVPCNPGFSQGHGKSAFRNYSWIPVPMLAVLRACFNVLT